MLCLAFIESRFLGGLPRTGAERSDVESVATSASQDKNRREHPPKVFAAGRDALDTITPVVEARLAELRTHAELSKAAGGTFTPAGSGS